MSSSDGQLGMRRLSLRYDSSDEDETGGEKARGGE